MMDDFKDLQWPSSSSPNAAPSRSFSAVKYDAFSLLASSSQGHRSSPNYLSSTNSSRPPSRPITPATMPSKPATNNSDAFSNLLDLGSNGSQSKLSIAERQAQADRERKQKELKDKEALKTQGAFWDSFATENGLRPTVAPTKPTDHKTPSSTPFPGKGDMLFDPLLPQRTTGPSSPAARPVSSPKPQPSEQPPKPKVSVWDFDLLTTESIPHSSSVKANSKSNLRDNILSDFDVLADKPPTRTSSQTQTHSQDLRSESPNSFDWGSREDGPSQSSNNRNGDGLDSDDEFMAIIGKAPAPDSIARDPMGSSNSPRQTSSPRPQRPSRSKNSRRSVSPPPHILGKLVEMGFSIQQARTALAATDTGLDVEAAAEILLTQTTAPDSPAFNASLPDREISQRRRPKPSSSADGIARRNPAPKASQDDEPVDTIGQLADTADKVLAQATEIGVTLFGKANAFWKSANRAYEERSSPKPDGEHGQASKPTAGRPKWMASVPDGDQSSDSPLRDRRTQDRRASPSGGFLDLDVDGGYQESSSSVGTGRTKPNMRDGRGQHQAEPSTARHATLLSSFEDGSPSYVSPHRRKPRPPPELTRPAATSKTGTQPPLSQKRVREYVSCPSSTLAESLKHRSAGTASYKLGQHDVAETSFSRAINLLPAGHMALVPVLNNRAMARIKTGDGPGAIADCSHVLKLIGPGWKLGDDAVGDGGADGAGVDLGEACVKAVTRRAMAYEMSEKWESAKADWETLASFGASWGPAGVKAKQEAFRGLQRCRRLSVGESAAPTPKPRPPPARRPVVASSKPSEGAVRLQAANRAAEAQEAERYELKDTIEAKLDAWKKGKETNVRALLTSLDTVLWPELGWAKINMADVITEQQVKIRYMKAIAKVHPDKLRNATVEHQMIANGVFGTLNEAFNGIR